MVVVCIFCNLNWLNVIFLIRIVFWAIASSSMMVIFGWMLVAIYFGVVLLIILLLCGIQLVQLFIKHWSNRKHIDLIFFKGKSMAFICLVYSDGIHAVSWWYCYGSISSRKSTTGEFYILIFSVSTCIQLRIIDQSNKSKFSFLLWLFVSLFRYINKNVSVSISLNFLLQLCGIFVTIFHFRRLSKAQSDEINRQVTHS